MQTPLDAVQLIDVSYPADNRRLFDEIAAGGGALLSDFALGIRPEPWRFPACNRLISGTALSVLVIESPADSGSLITVREAGEQGREVFAIPAPPTPERMRAVTSLFKTVPSSSRT